MAVRGSRASPGQKARWARLRNLGRVPRPNGSDLAAVLAPTFTNSRRGDGNVSGEDTFFRYSEVGRVRRGGNSLGRTGAEMDRSGTPRGPQVASSAHGHDLATTLEAE